jgi:hypothetical protein
MKTFIATSFVCVVLAGSALSRADEIPEFPKPTQQHAWLQQLVGEWESESEIYIEGQSPIKTKGTERVRSVGGFWTIADHHSDFMGQTFAGVMTLGYDTTNAQFVGTWVDSMSGYLWNYTGTLDATGKILTLEAEGPCPMNPDGLSKFKEVLEIEDKDHKTFSSSVLAEDGKWIPIMKIEYSRK